MEKTKYTVRELRIKDFFSLHRMYDSLDEKKTKPFFHVYWLGLKPSRIKWVFTQIALFSSTLKTLRKLFFVIYPFIVFLSIVAIDERAKVIGFIFLIIRKRLPEGGFLAEFGICVGDNYRGRGIGTALMEKLIALAPKEKKEGLLSPNVSVGDPGNKKDRFPLKTCGNDSLFCF